jgi:hypothetical protein
VLAEAIINELAERVHRLYRVVTFGADLDLGASRRRQQQQPEYALGINPFLTCISSHKINIAFECCREADETGGSPRVKAESIPDRNCASMRHSG